MLKRDTSAIRLCHSSNSSRSVRVSSLLYTATHVPLLPPCLAAQNCTHVVHVLCLPLDTAGLTEASYKMSVIGIDIGYQNCTTASPKGGGIDVLLNEYSQRNTAAYVSFSDKQRELGEAGRLKAVTNFKSTVCYFKHLLGMHPLWKCRRRKSAAIIGGRLNPWPAHSVSVSSSLPCFPVQRPSS